MAFGCILKDKVANGNFFYSPASFSVIIPVGYSDSFEEEKTYSLFVGFDPLIGTDDLEYTFGIIEHDEDTDGEYVYWSGKEIASFIDRDDRNLIGGALLEATAHLLRSRQPKRFLMCTRDGNAPPKAHVKFTTIAHLFHRLGYVVTKADPYHGQQVWWMEHQGHSQIEPE